MAQAQGGIGGFVRLWLVLAFSYALLRLLTDLLISGYVDIRTATLVEYAIVPFGQTLVCRIVSGRARPI
ncbi:MAG: hypothetical protein SF182_27790 [Deltaproteobacteria bacterium]|nr:hypothetical protein [Deltaproteobacteria bacterium]